MDARAAPCPIPAPGHMGVDYEERVDFDRLRRYRLERAQAALEASECGAFLLFDFYNIRYTTQTWIGGALRRQDDPLRPAGARQGPGALGLRLRGQAPQDLLALGAGGELPRRLPRVPGRGRAVRRADGDAVAEIKSLLTEAGVADLPVGLDIVEPPFLFEMQRQGLSVVDAQQLMLDARCIKSTDEIVLLNQAAAMVDGVYQDIVEALKPGVRENEIVALANQRLYEMGSDQVEAVNAISGERCNPHPHNFTDRLIRPGDQAFFDIIHSYNGYRTCYYRTFAVGSSTPAQRDAYKTGARVDGPRHRRHQGRRRHRRGRGAAAGARRSSGSTSEMEAFGLQFAHGLGLGLHERPIISRLNSMKEPVELQVGMVFALETYCPASDGFSAARIEEEIVITDDGPKILTLFPAQDLVVTNPY